LLKTGKKGFRRRKKKVLGVQKEHEYLLIYGSEREKNVFSNVKKGFWERKTIEKRRDAHSAKSGREEVLDFSQSGRGSVPKGYEKHKQGKKILNAPLRHPPKLRIVRESPNSLFWERNYLLVTGGVLEKREDTT